jgi:hypothetical protein
MLMSQLPHRRKTDIMKQTAMDPPVTGVAWGDANDRRHALTRTCLTVVMTATTATTQIGRVVTKIHGKDDVLHIADVGDLVNWHVPSSNTIEIISEKTDLAARMAGLILLASSKTIQQMRKGAHDLGNTCTGGTYSFNVKDATYRSRLIMIV